ncbi:hypothetical protein V6N12_013940 [Hibiscus sabdariffa]|uniref:Uncharacterized protein n=1 Tax=Hibiscus sabdariffa TaxID=183260 RepID=A0ABR2B1R6_9ROSI
MPLSIPLFISDETSSECHSENSVNEQVHELGFDFISCSTFSGDISLLELNFKAIIANICIFFSFLLLIEIVQLYHPRVMGTSVSIAVVASSSSIKFFSWSPQFYDGVGIACLLNTTLVLPKFEVIAY